MRHLFLLFALLISGLAQAGTNPFDTKPDFLPVDQAFMFTSERLESGETQLFGRSPTAITCIRNA